jgi:SNF2 family DNA or RNA helicase
MAMYLYLRFRICSKNNNKWDIKNEKIHIETPKFYSKYFDSKFLQYLESQGKIYKDEEFHKHFNDTLGIGVEDIEELNAFGDFCGIDVIEGRNRFIGKFLKITNLTMITPEFIKNEKDGILQTFMHWHCNFLHTFKNTEIDNTLWDYRMKNIISDSEKQRVYQIKEYDFFKELNTTPYLYQKDNLTWMINRESKPVKYIIPEDKLCYFPDGRIFNTNKGCFITHTDLIQGNSTKDIKPCLYSFNSGFIMDDVGIGKTLQMICLIKYDPSIKTLIVVPNHLYEHWQNEFLKHCKFIPNNYNIIKFDEISALFSSNYNFDRIIIDEIHELYTDNYEIFDKYLLQCKIKYKWGMTATPFPTQDSMFNILQFLTNSRFKQKKMVRYDYLRNLWPQLFRKNCKDNIIKEMQLPPMNINNEFIDFRDEEAMIYHAELLADKNLDEIELRKICCDIMINIKNHYCERMTKKQFEKAFLQKYYNEYINEKIKEDDIRKNLNLCEEKIKETSNNFIKKQYYDNYKHYEHLLNEQIITTENRKRSYEYLKDKIENVEEECPVCCDDIEEEKQYSITPCGHVFCPECANTWFKAQNKTRCAVCNKYVDPNKVVTIDDINKREMMYSSKLDKLLDIINSQDKNQKFVLYTQFDDMIERIITILEKEGISSERFYNNNSIQKFMKTKTKLLLLSSKKNASGVDLTFAKNLIIFEPVKGESTYVIDMEKQIIGRLHRMGQDSVVNIHRLIINNTIEEKIYNEINS